LAILPETGSTRASNSFSLSGLVPYRIRTKGETRTFQVLLVISGIIILVIAVYYFLNMRPVIGDQLVNLPNRQPFEIPPPGTFPFYVKPITILFVSATVFAFCLCTLSQGFLVRHAPRPLRAVLLLLSVLLFAMGVYEVFFNFALWSALMVSNPNLSPDLLVNSYPVHTVMINLAYATKITVLWCVVAFFGIMTFRASLVTEEIKEV
jgi:hypothetical protein